MIDPNDVNLIIFDMDGTITPSLPAVYEAIKRAFTRLGWPVTFGAGEIGRFFGQSAAGAGSGLFEFITPAGSRPSHEEGTVKNWSSNIDFGEFGKHTRLKHRYCNLSHEGFVSCPCGVAPTPSYALLI